MDPRKRFMCKDKRHIVCDSQRPFGDSSICPYCEQEAVNEAISAGNKVVLQPTSWIVVNLDMNGGQNG